MEAKGAIIGIMVLDTIFKEHNRITKQVDAIDPDEELTALLDDQYGVNQRPWQRKLEEGGMQCLENQEVHQSKK